MTSTVHGGVRGSAGPVGADPVAAGSAQLSAAIADFRYVGWFHELDAWTEYWDLYHPETRGHYYFGDGGDEPGLLSLLLPRFGRPLPFTTWVDAALGRGSYDAFRAAVEVPEVCNAVIEVDDLIEDMFARHFGDARDDAVREDYLEATHRFALDVLPAATERAAKVPPHDHRARTAGRHTLDGDVMWFAWALHTEAAVLLLGRDDPGHARRTLMQAGVATGCPANFVWRNHRRSRPEYAAEHATATLLRRRGMAWARDWDAATAEVRALYRIREWGTE